MKKASDQISHVINAIIAYNNQQVDRDLKLRISIPLIKAIRQHIGATYQPAIQQTLKERELERLHGNWMLGVANEELR